MSANSPTAESSAAFAVKDCALIAIATGRKAQGLKELRDILAVINIDSIYYHFWGGLMQPRFEEREFNNDFAAWARHALHDSRLAEQLAMIDPNAYPDLEDLRQELLELIEQRLDESEYLPWVRATRQFEFIRSQIVVFDTHRRLNHPRELGALLPHISTTSIFYHFVDGRRRHPDGTDDFRYWLATSFPEVDGPLVQRLAQVDPYFGPLTDLRRNLAQIFAEHFKEEATP